MEQPELNQPARSPRVPLSRLVPEGTDFHIEDSTAEDACRVTPQARLLSMDEAFSRTLVKRGGLVVRNATLLPTADQLQRDWMQSLVRVHDARQPMLFSVPGLKRDWHVGIVPTATNGELGVRLSRPRLCPGEAVTGYAALIGLTPREATVLDYIIQGLTPACIADALHTRESTVRTQIKSILSKSDHHSVRELLITLACLPCLAEKPEESIPARVAAAQGRQCPSDTPLRELPGAASDLLR